MTAITELRTRSFRVRANTIPYLCALAALGVFYLGLVLFEFVPRMTFIRSMPQDFFLQLDGIYRISAGQRIYADFSTPLGVALYAIPMLFVHSAGDLVLSINYASGLLLAIAFLAVAYLACTRLPPLLGLVFGIWIGLALAARMNFGDGPTVVSYTGIYNRQAYVALALALLMFRAPRTCGPTIGLADGLLYAILAAFQLYTKFSFGLVAIAFAPVVIWRQRNRLLVFSAFSVSFCLLVLAVEYGYGTNFRWLRAVEMTIAASNGSLSNSHDYFHALLENLPELLVCTLIPAWFLWSERRLTLLTTIFFVMVAGASLALILSNGQGYFLFLPAILFFVSAPQVLPRYDDLSREAKVTRHERRGDGFVAVTLAVLTLGSGPQFLNLLYAAYWTAELPPMVADDAVLGRIVSRSLNFEDHSTLTSSIVGVRVAAVDAFAIGRDYHPQYPTDALTMLEYRDYLTSGMRAARQGCNPYSRILTLDFGNPFPLLLGWPPGGYMNVIHPGRFLSIQAHPSDEEMFRDVDCVLVPKLPVRLEARDFMLDVYGRYLSDRFGVVYETPQWRVLRLVLARSTKKNALTVVH